MPRFKVDMNVAATGLQPYVIDRVVECRVIDDVIDVIRTSAEAPWEGLDPEIVYVSLTVERIKEDLAD